MSSATLSSKGQLVIPTRLRNALHLRAGDKLRLTLRGEQLVVEKERPARALLGRSKLGRRVLTSPAGAPAITTESVNALLAELP